MTPHPIYLSRPLIEAGILQNTLSGQDIYLSVDPATGYYALAFQDIASPWNAWPAGHLAFRLPRLREDMVPVFEMLDLSDRFLRVLNGWAEEAGEYPAGTVYPRGHDGQARGLFFAWEGDERIVERLVEFLTPNLAGGGGDGDH